MNDKIMTPLEKAEKDARQFGLSLYTTMLLSKVYNLSESPSGLGFYTLKTDMTDGAYSKISIKKLL